MAPALYTSAQYEAFWTAVAAIAALLTFLVAAVAALFAWWQVVHAREARKEEAIRARQTQEAEVLRARELQEAETLRAREFQEAETARARELREEQAQPYVVVDFEPQANILITLVVKNTGLTVAHDVKLMFDPPLESTFDRDPPLSETKFITEGIPTMPPGRTWTALFDRGPDRYANTELPRSYDVTVTFRDSHNRSYSLPYRLDLDIFFGIRNVGRYDIHEAAEALREIRKTLARWTEGFHGLTVFTRDGDAKDARDEQERERMLRTLETNRREDGSIISEWVEQQMGSEWDESQIAMEPLPAKEASESISARFKQRRRDRQNRST